jgi:exosortase H (IPTLxxWG-CTERM-specific)
MAGPNSSRPGPRGSFGFLARFAGLLLLFYLAVAWRPADAAVVVPFTSAIARVSAWLLNLLGENVAVAGTEIRSPTFAVSIENGCNGLETVLLFAAAVLAFPASWKRRLAGLLLGFAAIQIFNLLRVVSLFWIGAHAPSLFSTSHTVLWQSFVVLFGVLLFLYWASRARDGMEARARA